MLILAGYMAPEVASGGQAQYGPQADIYSLGITVLQGASYKPHVPNVDPGELPSGMELSVTLPPDPRLVDRLLPSPEQAYVRDFVERCTQR